MSTQGLIDCNKYLDENGPCVSYVEVWQAATLDERERCAKVCAEVAADYAKQARGGDMSGKSDAMQQGAEECESAIRALPEDRK